MKSVKDRLSVKQRKCGYAQVTASEHLFVRFAFLVLGLKPQD